MNEYAGDRECPDCLEETLVEDTWNKWKCLKCGKVFNEEWLEGDEDESEN